jgi:hypothetical protein
MHRNGDGPRGRSFLREAGELEDVPRVDAVKGGLADDHTFVIDRLAIGLGQPPERWTLTFGGNRLKVRVKFDDWPEMTAQGETGR